METRYSTCVFCDGGCSVKAVYADDGTMSIYPADESFPALCSKARKIDEYRLHPDRIVKPLKNIGKRGEPQWIETSWDEALDEIAERLQAVVETYGPEAVAFSEMPLNIGFGALTRRLMNCIGTPNYTAPTQLCMGNTAQVHRAVYGWFCLSRWDVADCVVYFGQDRDAERWPAEYLRLKEVKKRGGKLVVVDPRLTDTAKMADYHLRIRYGTDAALALAWINVIIEEELYDKEFVEHQCIGFENLARHMKEYDPKRVAGICGIESDLIRETARLYATSSRSIIPWGATADMQSNSTSLIHAQCILRAICGFLNTSETVPGPAVGGQGNAETSRFDWLSEDQLSKQLGADRHPLLTYRASQLYEEANERVGAARTQDVIGESVACIPPALFAAMRGEGPYPVKAMFSIGNNTVMSYANQQGIIDAFMNQDLVVAFEHWMTPTAQLADFVLPGDMWAERSTLGGVVDVAPMFSATQALCEPVEDCKSWFFVVKSLADRLGYSDRFPWANEEEYYDWRLEGLGATWKEAYDAAPAPLARTAATMSSFVTPTGKVELESTVMKKLGFGGLPSYVEPTDKMAGNSEFPYVLFAGYRERKSYNTNLHQIESLRRACPEPYVYINPADAKREGVSEDQWVRVESGYGKVLLKVHIDDAQPEGTLRVPHGWWKPETEQGLAAGLSSACLHNDGMLFPDDDWNLDPVQGVPNLRGGIHGRIVEVEG